jgi:hypothetical protein
MPPSSIANTGLLICPPDRLFNMSRRSLYLQMPRHTNTTNRITTYAKSNRIGSS